MALRYTYDVNTGGAQQLINPGFAILSFTCRNTSLAVLNITDERGANWSVQAGQVATFELPAPVSQLAVTASFATAQNGAKLIVSDAPLPDETTSTAAVTVANFPGVQHVNIDSTTGTLPINISSTSGNIPVNIAGAAGVTISTQDVLVETNTGILTGLLPSSTNAFTLASGNEQTTMIAAAVAGFGLSAVMPGAGRLNCWLVATGQTIYLLRDLLIYNGPNSNAPIEKRFAVPMPANAVLHVRWDDSTVSASFVLRV